MFELLFTHTLWAYRTGAFAFASAWPRWTLVLSIVVGAALIFFTLQRRRELGWRRLVPVGVLQTLMLACVLCLLWRPVLNVERVRDRENILAIALDASASMVYGEGGKTRLQEAANALQAGAMKRMEETFEVRLFGFSQSAAPIDVLDAMPPTGVQTRIGDALTQVLEIARAGVSQYR